MQNLFKLIIVTCLLVGTSSCSLSQSSTASDGTIIYKGYRYFPVGYFTDQISDYPTAIAKLKGAGFNSFYLTPQIVGQTGIQQALKTAAANNLTAIVALDSDAQVNTRYINALKESPALLAWFAQDDANNVTPAEIMQITNAIQNADPKHITTISLIATPFGALSEPSLDSYLPTSSVPQFQSYPIYNQCSSECSVENVYWDELQIASEAAKYNRAAIANLQVFSWNDFDYPGNRWPTSSEVDVMSYLAVIAGVKGIMNYTLFDYGDTQQRTIDVTHPDVWNASVNVAKELPTLSPYLLNGTHSSSGSKEDSVYQGYWTYNGKLLIIIANARTSDQSVVVPLPMNATGPAIPVFKNRPNSLVVRGSTMTGHMDALSVEMYLLNVR